MADRLGAFAEQTGVDEIMVTSNIHDHAARLRSYEITAEVGAALAGGSAAQEAGASGVSARCDRATRPGGRLLRRSTIRVSA